MRMQKYTGTRIPLYFVLVFFIGCLYIITCLLYSQTLELTHTHMALLLTHSSPYNGQTYVQRDRTALNPTGIHNPPDLKID